MEPSDAELSVYFLIHPTIIPISLTAQEKRPSLAFRLPHVFRDVNKNWPAWIRRGLARRLLRRALPDRRHSSFWTARARRTDDENESSMMDAVRALEEADAFPS